MEILPTTIRPWLLVSTLMVVVLNAPSPCLATTSSDNTTTDELALLSFASLLSDSTGALSSWNRTGDAATAVSGYCRWRGVSCGLRGGAQRVVALNLTSLDLAGPLSSSLSNLTFLETLDLSGNLLRGRLTPEVGRLVALQYLNISYNSVAGEIPSNLSRCMNLQYLDLSNNLLTGSIPASLGSFQNLIFLHLSANNLTGIIPPALGNLTLLANIALDQNNLQGPIPSTFGRLAKLKKVWLYSNNLSGAVPSSFFNISSLVEIVVGNNKLSGSLPPDMGITLPKLQIFAAFNNHFEGYLPSSLANASELWYLVILNNNFRGPLPPELGSSGRLLQVILGQNQFEARDEQQWRFLTSLTNSTGLEGLNLGYNKLEGPLPASFLNLSTNLVRFSLSHNRLSGSIPPEIGKFTKLNKFALDQNMFQGVIPPTIGNLKQLKELYMHSNELKGEIPSSIGDLTQLTILDLSNNRLQGGIPGNIGDLTAIAALNLSYNELSGAIPREVMGLSSLTRYLDISHNSFTGNLPPEVGNLKNLATLNISQNELSGEIPGTLGLCVVMEQLYMQGNCFYGAIPLQLRGLRAIQELDLSSNNLSGSIPDFLESLSLHYLNLSYNHLVGQVPDAGVFSNFSAVWLAGNAGLCGGNSSEHFPPCRAESSAHNSSRLKLILAVSLPPSVIVIVLLLFGACYSIRTRERSSTSPRTFFFFFFSQPFHRTPYDGSFYEREKISYNQIREATNGFSESTNLIGQGSFGKVYRGVLGSEPPKVVAIKVLNLERRGALKSFIAECSALRNLRHRNIVKIVTACSSVDHKGDEFKALVFDYMPNGNLDEWLHPRTEEGNGSRRLTLEQRMSIAIDVASALVYLHDEGHAPIVHSDLKPSNVLIDEKMSAHLADFGLARMLEGPTGTTTKDSTNSMAVKGSIGYIAPEYGMGSEASTACDVYSYGVLLLEMFTGKRPVDDAFTGEQDLHAYVEMAIEVVADQTLLLAPPVLTEHGSMMQSLLVSIFQIGLLCSKHSPRDRMKMTDVLSELHTIREAFYEDISLSHRQIIMLVE